MKLFQGETDIKKGDRISYVVEKPNSYLEIGDVLEGEVEMVFDGSTSHVFDEISAHARPAPFPLFHVKLDTKNGEPFSDEMQCGEKYLTKKEG